MNYEYLSAAELSDVGRQRRRNEDKTLVLARHGVFAVFDGMGGASGGSEASQSAAESLRRKFAETAAQPTGLAPLKAKVIMVRSALNEASREIRERADAQGIAGSGTTAVALIFDATQPQRAIILHAGDSRAYRYRGDQMVLLTRDHSFAVAAGVTSERSLPPMFRGVVTRAVGLEREVVLEETLVDVSPGDTFMLCSDGLTKMIADGAINQVFRRVTTASLSALAAVLIEEANTAGGHDNASVVLVGVSGFVPANVVSKTQQPAGQAQILPLFESKPLTEEISPAMAQRAAIRSVASQQKTGTGTGLFFAGALAVAAVAVGLIWYGQREQTKPGTPNETIAANTVPATTNSPIETASPPPANQNTQIKNTEPVHPSEAVHPPVAAVPPPVVPAVIPTQKTVIAASVPPIVLPVNPLPPVTVTLTQSAVMAAAKIPSAVAQTQAVVMAMTRPPDVPPVIPKTQVASTQTPVVPPPPKVETPAPPPRAPTRTPEAVAAAQATMEMLMMDALSALSNGHWSFVEETIAEWAPNAPYESAAFGAWPVYRGWSAVWREASTGQRSVAELYKPYREKVSACLRELGSAASNLPALKQSKDARADADELCRARYDAQNLLLDEMRRRGEDTVRLGDLLQKGNLLDTAAALRRKANHVDIAAIGGDLDARAQALVATTRAARGNPAPMSADDITSNFTGWTSLRVGEEELWAALIDIIRDADVRSLGDSARRKELNALRDKIADGHKKKDKWNAWLSGDGPADVIKFLMLAQSQAK